MAGLAAERAARDFEPRIEGNQPLQYAGDRAAPDKTVFETRHVYLKSDSDELKKLRDEHWMLYWAENSGNLPEDWEAWLAQQRGVQSVGVRYSLLARGEPADHGLRGDDNRIRSFWSEWRKCMGTATNAPPH